MTLWLILTIMTSAAAVWLSVPLVRRFDRPPAESAGDIEIYRDQLQEIEREWREGLIDDTQAETARVEIKRRILTTDRSAPRAVMPKLSAHERNFALICVTGIVVLGSVGLYAVTGNPDLALTRPPPSPRPHAGEPQRGSDSSSLSGFAAAEQIGAFESERAQTGLPTVEEMIQRLAARLLRNPKDTEGWRTLGWSYLNIGRFPEAAEAYARAIELDPNSTEFRGGRIEALVGSADGIVTSEAKTAIEDTLKLDPKNVRARFFMGLAEKQSGDKALALAEWTELLKDANPDESWVPDLKNRISELKREMGVDGGAPADGPKPVIAQGLGGTLRAQEGPQTPRAVERGPSPQDVQTAEAMAPADRSLMIRGMVDGLANRLEQSPRDAEGWIKLIQSRMVLGERELAKQALARGLKAFADDAPERDRIAAAAQQLGLDPPRASSEPFWR
jgi:cytochrome c-type biogenesis protein CcmH